MLISTKDKDAILKIAKDFKLPKKDAHKGDNGKVLIIGGSSLFHSASIWAAEMASHIVDMVHYSSTEENNEILTSIKKKFINGIVIERKNILDYVKEDDSILIGPGMVRGEKRELVENLNFDEITSLKDEADYTRSLINYLIRHYPEKRFVFDAGALQMMDKEWLLELKEKPILTPHSIEFERLFEISIKNEPELKKEKLVKETAKKYNCVILFKSVKDIISDGDGVYIIEGGNAGLAKGGSGDILASLACSFYAKNDSLLSGVLASWIIKKTGDELFLKHGYWYNISNIIDAIPNTLRILL
ncbi:MAG: NAD(P)H-hydrate dehydratase [bacterium]|nr:NAD(P)H-hydrate dehydratase [bacterium]